MLTLAPEPGGALAAAEVRVLVHGIGLSALMTLCPLRFGPVIAAPVGLAAMGLPVPRGAGQCRLRL